MLLKLGIQFLVVLSILSLLYIQVVNCQTAKYNGFFYVETYPDTQCSTASTFSFGYKLEQCITEYDTNANPVGSFYGSCDGFTYTLDQYDTPDCTGISYTATTRGLDQCYPQNDNYGQSISFTCSRDANTLPLHSYAVVSVGYEGAGADTCGGTITAFEAVDINECFGEGQYNSFQLLCSNDGNTITDRLYYDQRNCARTFSDTEVPSGCFAVDSPEFEVIASVLKISAYNNVEMTPTTPGKAFLSPRSRLSVDDDYRPFANTTYLFNDVQVACLDNEPNYDGFFYVQSYTDSTCSTEATFSYGYRLEDCIVEYNTNLEAIGSYAGTCDGFTFYLTSYNSIDCSGPPTTATVSNLNECVTMSDNFGQSIIASCSTEANVVPGRSTGVTFVGYEGGGADTCGGNITSFETYAIDTCFKDSTSSSYEISCSTDFQVVSKDAYPTVTTCTGNYNTNSFNTGCISTNSSEFQTIDQILPVTMAIQSALKTTGDVAFLKPPFGGNGMNSQKDLTSATGGTILYTNLDAECRGTANQDYTGFFYVEAYEDTQCLSPSTFSFGYKLQQCITEYNSNLQPIGSIYGTCDGDAFTLNHYSSYDCSGTPIPARISNLNRCIPNYDQYGLSQTTRCSMGPDIPHDDTNIVLAVGYEGAGSSTCAGTVTSYEAIEINQCFDQGSGSGSYFLNCKDSPALITDSLYSSNDCTGSPQVTSIPRGCFQTNSSTFQTIEKLLNVAEKLVIISPILEANANSDGENKMAARMDLQYLPMQTPLQSLYKNSQLKKKNIESERNLQVNDDLTDSSVFIYNFMSFDCIYYNSYGPTASPSLRPSPKPTLNYNPGDPTGTPSFTPISTPTLRPSIRPTIKPSVSYTPGDPTGKPSVAPRALPTGKPVPNPTLPYNPGNPTLSPTRAPVPTSQTNSDTSSSSASSSSGLSSGGKAAIAITIIIVVAAVLFYLYYTGKLNFGKPAFRDDLEKNLMATEVYGIPDITSQAAGPLQNNHQGRSNY